MSADPPSKSDEPLSKEDVEQAMAAWQAAHGTGFAEPFGYEAFENSPA